MRYYNIKTGFVFDTACEAVGANWQPVTEEKTKLEKTAKKTEKKTARKRNTKKES